MCLRCAWCGGLRGSKHGGHLTHPGFRKSCGLQESPGSLDTSQPGSHPISDCKDGVEIPCHFVQPSGSERASMDEISANTKAKCHSRSRRSLNLMVGQGNRRGNRKRLSVHTFRHTHISHALSRWGRNVSVVQKWVGHKKLETTQLYVHVSADDLHRETMKTG